MNLLSAKQIRTNLTKTLQAFRDKRCFQLAVIGRESTQARHIIDHYAQNITLQG